MGYAVQTCGIGWRKKGRKGQYDATLRHLIEYVSFTRNLVLGECRQVCAEARKVLRTGQRENFSMAKLRLAVSRVSDEQINENRNLLGSLGADLGIGNRPEGTIRFRSGIAVTPEALRLEVGLQGQIRSDASYWVVVWSVVVSTADVP